MVLGSYLAPWLFCDPPDLVLLVESQPQSPAPILTNETKKIRNEKQLQRARYGMEREMGRRELLEMEEGKKREEKLSNTV